MKFLIYFVLFVILFVIYVRYLENHSIFFPPRHIQVTPDQIGLNYEDVYFITSDHVKLNGWFLPREGAQATVIYFHGNAGNIGDCLATAHFFHGLGVNVFMVDYRGYGNSEGHPTEKGIYLDAMAAYDYLLKRSDIQADKIVAYGVSLGGVAAVDLATQRKLAALIVDSSISSARDMARKMYPFIPSIFMSVKMDSVTKVRSIHVPTFFIHSVNDQTVPYAFGKKLFEAANEPKTFVTVNGSHNELREGEDEENVVKGLLAFLKENQLL